jgi:toxin ParE1/3/4
VSVRRLVFREQAQCDAEEAIGHYLAEAGDEVALRFIDALQSAYRAIAGHPSAGSPRHAVELDLPGLCNVLLNGFPYLVFYLDGEARVEVWRVLHAHRDLPTHLE